MKKQNHTSFFLALTFLAVQTTTSQSPTKLWFDEPATYFEESLVLGNGKMGASVFGGVESDKIYLNDATLWSGEPVDPYMNPDAHISVPQVREALVKEDYKLADQLNRNIQGKFTESFAPLGTLFLNFEHKGEVRDYYRELDISKAISITKYRADGVNFSREYLISHPDQIMVVKLSADKKSALNFSVKFNSLLKYSTKVENSVLKADGYAPYYVAHNIQRYVEDPVRFDEHRGTRYSSYLRIKKDGGKLTFTDSSLVVKGASEAVIYLSIATSFNGFDKDPAKEGLDNKAIAARQLSLAFKKDYEEIREEHLIDYQQFFNRVELSLGESSAPDLTTDERLKRYFHGAEDKNLEVLYFHYGRYLLISSSRTKAVPATLQGIWNPYVQPPWCSNYTMNINVEENYWMAETANLSEMHMPLLSYIDNLSKTGKVTALTFYGIDKGWAACHTSDIWAMSNPVGDFGKGSPQWANWNMSGTWLVTHLWEHYQFTRDKDFLKEQAYPLMKGSAEFCLNWMIKDRNGRLITSPSTSPENRYLSDKGYRGATLFGGTADLAMIRESFMQLVEASKVLDVDADFRAELEQALANMHPYQIGEKGNLQEWYHDWEDSDPQHRHQSHLFGLHPGNHITPDLTPELAAACRKSLEIKGDESTGWSKGWRINLWARLQDGNRAYKMFRELLQFVEPSGLHTNYSKGGGTYPNLFDAHPPFQIDGNFGGAAGVVEMLLQSHQRDKKGDYIQDILPALPSAYPDGKISGIKGRGAFEFSIEWKEGKLVSLEVKSLNGNNLNLRYRGKLISQRTKAGEVLSFGSSFTGRVAYESGQGIPNATVMLVNSSNSEECFETRTDSKGKYSIDGLIKKPGPLDVHITGKGILPYHERDVVFSSEDHRDFIVRATDLWDENRIVLRSSLNNSRHQFRQGTGRVVFMGGSITNMPGWRIQVEKYLTETFPETKFKFIEAGVPSLGSLYHSFRYQRDILSKGKVDLLLLESAVNDGSEHNRTNNTVRTRAHEGIIRQARLANPEVDIVQMHFLSKGYYDSDFEKDELIPEYEAYEVVGRPYSCSMIEMSRFVAERYTWEEFGGNVHPKGHAANLYADNIIAMFTLAWKDPLPRDFQKFSYPLPRLVDEFSYVNGRFVSIDKANSLSGWKRIESGVPKIEKKREDFTDRPLLSGKPGDSLKFNFKGILVGVEGVEYNNLGRLTYSIDNGMYTGIIDTHSEVPLYIGRAIVFEDELDDGDHVLTLTVEPAANGSTVEVMILNFLVN